jgi:hypothetical protein
MTYAQAILTRLQSDTVASPVFPDGTPLATLLPGGIILIQEPGRKGLNRVQDAIGFDPKTGIIKPLAVVMELKEAPTGEIINSPTGKMSTRTPELVWIYANGDPDAAGNDPYEDIIRPAYNRIYRLLHTWRIPEGFQVLWRDTVRDKREPDLKDAAYYLAGFIAHGWRQF